MTGADGPLLGGEKIKELLTELGWRLDQRGIEGRLFLVRGAAMALAYSRDRVTRDLDAVFEPKMEIYTEALYWDAPAGSTYQLGMWLPYLKRLERRFLIVLRNPAARMAAKQRLPDHWLNDAVKGLLPDQMHPIEGTASFSSTGIHVGVASAEYLFAMKAHAARQETDGDDLRVGHVTGDAQPGQARS